MKCAWTWVGIGSEKDIAAQMAYLLPSIHHLIYEIPGHSFPYQLLPAHDSPADGATGCRTF
jgi:hypothetical protein